MGGWGGVEWDAGNVDGGARNRALSGLAASRSSLRVPGAFMDGQKYKVLLFSSIIRTVQRLAFTILRISDAPMMWK